MSSPHLSFHIFLPHPAFKPDIVVTEKGVSDLAQHYFAKAGITAFRRLRKTDNNRMARATGATIVSRADEIQESDIGTLCGLFEMRKIGEEWFAFFEECQDPKACTVLLRGGSKDVLNEIERNLHDAMQVVRNVVYEPKLLPGGGATEMAVSIGLRRAGIKVEGVQQGPYVAVGEAMEVIPRTLAQNCGVSVIRTVTELRAKHAAHYDADAGSPCNIGVDGITGEIKDMAELGIWEPFSVKRQTVVTAIESAWYVLMIFFGALCGDALPVCSVLIYFSLFLSSLPNQSDNSMILRIDDVVSGSRKAQG